MAMTRSARMVRMLPAPAKAGAKAMIHAVDPIVLAAYRRRTGEGAPIPPSRLRARAGRSELDSYLSGGRATAEELLAALGRHGRSLDEFHAVYDFGCGAGGVMRHLIGRAAPEASYSGSDVDREAIEWAQRNLPAADWRVNGYRPPLPFEEARFDLVYSVSILTHLNEDLQFAWINELKRVLRPGGIALLTVHGELAYEQCRSRQVISNSRGCAERVANHGPLAEEQFVYEPYTISSWNRQDFPGIDDTFGMSFHSPAYIEREWSSHVDVLGIVPGAWQDVVVCSRRGQSG